MNEKYVVNTPEVVAEVIDGELVAIHLGSGCYYHSNKSGSVIWQLVENGQSINEITVNLSKIFSIEKNKSNEIAIAFVKKLAKEKLIKKLSEDEKIKQTKKMNKLKSLEYETPTLKKHTDMRELLLLDPIHDIGDEEMPLQTVD